MAKNIDVNNIHLEIEGIEFFCNNRRDGMIINWSSDIGFGEYKVYITSEGELKADAETMDGGDDKAFGRKLMELLMDKITIAR